MINKNKILTDLEYLDAQYNAALTNADIRLSVFMSKLALLELCGWLEYALDTIADRSVKNKIKTVKYSNKVSSIISRNYGFKYDENFMEMMIKIMGLSRCEVLSSALDNSGEAAILNSKFSALSIKRNQAAHVNQANSALVYDSPSVIINELNVIFPILRKIYSHVCHK